MSRNPPDTNWYMDTGATNHMTSFSGDLSSYFNLSSRTYIVVGSEDQVLIHGHGHTPLNPLFSVIKQILMALLRGIRLVL